MQHSNDLNKTTSLGEKINNIIQNLPNGSVTLKGIVDIVGIDSMMLLTIFLSLVFLIPVSIPGVSTVFGSAILLIGVTKLVNRKLWLPEHIAQREISSEKLKDGLQKAMVWLRRLEKISRPHRLSWLVTGRGITLTNKLAFILAAVLLMFPFGFIPFSNTIPAVALIFLSVGLMQKDGGSILLGHLSNLITIIYFAILIFGGGLGAMELFRLMMGG